MWCYQQIDSTVNKNWLAELDRIPLKRMFNFVIDSGFDLNWNLKPILFDIYISKEDNGVRLYRMKVFQIML